MVRFLRIQYTRGGDAYMPMRGGEGEGGTPAKSYPPQNVWEMNRKNW